MDHGLGKSGVTLLSLLDSSEEIAEEALEGKASTGANMGHEAH